MSRITDRVAVITGATRGVGRATARCFAQAGCRLVLGARGEEPLQALADELGPANGNIVTVPTDVTHQDECQRLVQTALARFGTVDIVVANAGIGWVAPLHEQTDEWWHRVVDVNLHGVYYTVKAAIPHMIERQAGHLIIISSVNAIRPNINWGAYVPTKYATRGLAEMLQLELKPNRIKVSQIHLGGVRTTFRSGFDERWAAPNPQAQADPDRVLTPEDCADAVLWCAESATSPSAVPVEIFLQSWATIR